nr:zinc finger, CCHC-type [Tanacetum cinerariifolium]
MASNTVKDMTTNFGKLDKFEGYGFRRWQKKMHFLLKTLKVVYVLTTPMPELLEDATVEAIRIRAKWENDDYICRGHILNGISDSLFDVYTNVESAKEFWDSLESKLVMEQYNELLRIFGQYTQHGLKMDESIFVSSIIDKFPHSWKDFKHTLKHGKDDLSLVQLGSHFRIEESLRAQDSNKGKGKEVGRPSINMTEEGGKNKHHKQNKGIAEVVKRTTQMLVVWERGLRTNPKTKFKTYEPVEDGSILYLGDDNFAPVYGKGSMALEFSSGKTITLFNVLYVPKLSIDAIFDENCFSSIPRLKDIIPNSDESQRDDHSDDVPNETEPRKGCKWIFKRKMKVDGTVDKFKARLVIQGFRQKEGINYFDTYAPVARITTIRLLLALAAIHNLVIHQMDVKTTFLNGDLKEVYMKQPERFVMSGNGHKVCKLVKSLYGPKQAPKQWHQKFDEVLLLSFHLNQSDNCVYSKFDDSDKCVIICLYVDDMLIFGTDQDQVDKTKKFLSSRFLMKDMGESNVILEAYSDASWINHVEDSSFTSGWVFLLGGGAISWAFKKKTCITGSTMESEFVALVASDMGESNVILGIKIKRENKRIVITQSHYIENILKKFNREDCSPVSTPMDPVEKLKLNTGKLVDQLEYSRAIGYLMYVMTSTRPDIAYVIGRLS